MLNKYSIFKNIIYKTSLLPVRKSALFIRADKAIDTFAYVTPHIDFIECLAQKAIIEKEIILRKTDFNFEKLEKLWNFYEDLSKRKLELEERKSEVSKELNKLMQTESESNEFRKWKIQNDLLKDNLKKLKKPLWAAEEAAMIEALKLPNRLHPDTPFSETKVIYEHLVPPKNNKTHLDIGEQLNILQYNNSQNYYLKGDAALFELGAKVYFSNILKQNSYIQFSNPDFVKSVIVEGCGSDHTNPNSTFILHHNEESEVNQNIRLHLTGGASLFPYFAFHSKCVVYSKLFPLKYFTIGRQYVPSSAKAIGLLDVSQASVIHLFNATRNTEELNTILIDIIDIIKTSYAKLGYHFRVCLISADELKFWESMRISIQMYSASVNAYTEIGNISVSGNFISKRLKFTYIDQKQSFFPHILSGNILNVPKFLACVMEQNEEFTLPPAFQAENWCAK